MNTARRLQIATRIHLLLLRELGEGIDVKRMLGEKLYARDVLLVCDAHPGTDLASLAMHFRRETERAEHDPHHAGSSTFGDSTGFGLSRPADSELHEGDGAERRPRWFQPSRWLR